MWGDFEIREGTAERSGPKMELCSARRRARAEGLAERR